MIKDRIIDIEKLFFKEIEVLGPYEDNLSIAIAISGGVDSMVLAFLANKWIKNYQGKIIGLTINHNLREESIAEAAYVSKILQEQNIEHHIIDWQHIEKPTSNIQQKAREARYKLLTDWCKQNNILHLVVAHHNNDQAETFYMRLERGSGIEGLSGMSKISYKHNIRILRPLIEVSKKNILNYATLQNLNWVQDPSNTNEKFERVKIRNKLSSDDLFTSRLTKTAKNIARARNSVEKNIADNMVQMLKIFPAGYLEIDLNKFRKLQEEEALTILSRSICLVGDLKNKLRFKSLYELYKKIKTEKQFISTLGNCKIIQNYHIISIIKEIRINIAAKLKSNLYFDNSFVFHLNDNYQRDNFNIRYIREKDLKDVKKIMKNLKNWRILPAIYLKDKIIAIPFTNYNLNNLKYECYFKPINSLTKGIFSY